MATFKFKKFSSIENLQRTDIVQKMQLLNFDAFKGKWIATEKIHGANYSLHINDLEFRRGKRSSLLAEDGGSFYGDHAFITELRPKMEKLLALCKEKRFVPGEPTVTVYGEIFGGAYPHSDVTPAKGATRVQKGVWYSPKNEFMAFSLVIRDGEHTVWVPYPERVRLLTKVEIPHVPVLCVGTFDDVCKVRNGFQTKVPEILGYPSIEENICEGIVLEPSIPAFLPNGNRIVLKSKNQKFSEKKEAKRERKVPKDVPPEVARLSDEVALYITENRLRNVISKIGRIDNPKKVFGLLMKPFSEDILEDFEKDFPEFHGLDKKNQKLITKCINTRAATLIRENMYKIILGDF